MRLELKIVKFFKEIEKTIDISKHTNKYLIEKYYNHIGFNDDTPLNLWFINVATKKYPVFSAVEEAVKRARTYELRWRRNLDRAISSS